jgi:hypothetical protein
MSVWDRDCSSVFEDILKFFRLLTGKREALVVLSSGASIIQIQVYALRVERTFERMNAARASSLVLGCM